MLRRLEMSQLMKSAALALALAVTSGVASAQTSTGATHWQAWIGCWRLADDPSVKLDDIERVGGDSECAGVAKGSAQAPGPLRSPATPPRWTN